jgi:tetratricopeptide (TPR) repeat protein
MCWLAGLGLGQYETTFRENAIDADVLPELIEQHLSEMGVTLGHRLKNFHHVYAHAMREPIERNIIALRAALDAIRSTGGFVGSSLIISNLAEVSLKAGDLQRAEKDLREGLSFVEQSGEYYWAADLHRLSGQLAIKRQDLEAAESCFIKAIDIANGQGARLRAIYLAATGARAHIQSTALRQSRFVPTPFSAVHPKWPITPRCWCAAA